MKNLHNAIRTHRSPSTSPRDAGAFWVEFAQRTDGLDRVPRVATTGPMARVAPVAAAALLAIGAAFWMFAPGAVQAGVRVEALSIPVAHDSVFIINDAAGEGTIILIDGLRPDEPSEEAR